MPLGGNDWLALTPEPTLEPEIPICDAHHHLWRFDPVEYGWIGPADAALRREYRKGWSL